MLSPLRAVLQLALFFGGCLIVIPVQGLALRLGREARERVPMAFHRYFCRVVGITVQIDGGISRRRPTLFVSNHVSYLDIIVLGGLIQGCFVAKREIAGWPIFGLLTKLQRSILVDRRPRTAGGQRDAVGARLRAGDSIILFAEGTSGDGNRVLPFKSALFAAAKENVDGAPVAVQPVSIAYTRLDGMPLGRHLRPLVAWYGDMDLMPHLWTMMGLGRITAVVTFHQPVTLADFGTRKRLAEYCGQVVATGVAAALAGRRRKESLPAPEPDGTRAPPSAGAEPSPAA